MKIFRIIIAAPFVLIGALFYQVAEWISGEKYTRHETTVRQNVILEHDFHQVNMMNKARAKTGGKGFRTPKRK